jgi:hypothetical protein
VRKLADVCIHRPVFATMLILAMVVAGAVGYRFLAVDRYPAYDLPTVTVRTELPGGAPEEVEVAVTYPIEEIVNTVEGIRELRSISGAGTSLVLVTFDLGRDIDAAAQDVRDRVSQAMRRLPEECEPPVVDPAQSCLRPPGLPPFVVADHAPLAAAGVKHHLGVPLGDEPLPDGPQVGVEDRRTGGCLHHRHDVVGHGRGLQLTWTMPRRARAGTVLSRNAVQAASTAWSCSA